MTPCLLFWKTKPFQIKENPQSKEFAPIGTIVVVVVLLFYVHSKHLRSCRDGQLT